MMNAEYRGERTLFTVGCDTRNKEQKFLGFDTKQKLTKEIWPKETKKTKQFVRPFGWPIFEEICLKYSPISTPKGQFKQSECKLGICLSTATESQREPWTTRLLWIKILRSNMYCDVFKSDICLLYENRIMFTCFFNTLQYSWEKRISMSKIGVFYAVFTPNRHLKVCRKILWFPCFSWPRKLKKNQWKQEK